VSYEEKKEDSKNGGKRAGYEDFFDVSLTGTRCRAEEI